MLCAHPQTHCAESRLFGDYADVMPDGRVRLTVEKFADGLVRHNPAPDGHDPRRYRERMLRSIIEAIAATARNASGKPIYGEKFTPYRGTARAAVERLAAYRPDMPLIHLVRDGRDVVVSGAAQHLNYRIKAGDSNAAKLLAARRIPQDLFEEFLELWADSVSAGIEAERRFPGAIRISYEDMLRDAPGVLRCVLERIGAARDDDTVRACVQAASFEALSRGRKPGQEDRRSFFRKAARGDWVNWFTEEQTERFHYRRGALLGSLGYTTDGSPDHAARGEPPVPAMEAQ